MPTTRPLQYYEYEEQEEEDEEYDEEEEDEVGYLSLRIDEGWAEEEDQEDGEEYQAEIAGNLWILSSLDEDEFEEADTWRGYIPEDDSDNYDSDNDPWYQGRHEDYHGEPQWSDDGDQWDIYEDEESCDDEGDFYPYLIPAEEEERQEGEYLTDDEEYGKDYNSDEGQLWNKENKEEIMELDYDENIKLPVAISNLKACNSGAIVAMITEEQKEALDQLLKEYSDIFASEIKDLGKTHMV